MFELLGRLHRTHGLTSLIATHNLALAARCDRILTLEHGVLPTRKDLPEGIPAGSKRAGTPREKRANVFERYTEKARRVIFFAQV